MRPWHSWQLWREAMGAWKRTILDPCILCIYIIIILYYIILYILYWIYYIILYILLYICVCVIVCVLRSPVAFSFDFTVLPWTSDELSMNLVYPCRLNLSLLGSRGRGSTPSGSNWAFSWSYLAPAYFWYRYSLSQKTVGIMWNNMEQICAIMGTRRKLSGFKHSQIATKCCFLKVSQRTNIKTGMPNLEHFPYKSAWLAELVGNNNTAIPHQLFQVPEEFGRFWDVMKETKPTNHLPGEGDIWVESLLTIKFGEPWQSHITKLPRRCWSHLQGPNLHISQLLKPSGRCERNSGTKTNIYVYIYIHTQ